MAKVINWAEAQRWYVYGGTSPADIGAGNGATGRIHLPTYREIGAYYGIALHTVAKVAKRQNWTEIRKYTQDEITQEVNGRLKELQIKTLAQVNMETFELAELVIKKFAEALSAGKVNIYGQDALAFLRLRLEIAKKASDVEQDAGDPYSIYKNLLDKLLNGREG